MRNRYGARLVRPGRNWNRITLLMAENLRTGLVWKIFMKCAVAKRGLERAGFRRNAEL